MSNDGTNDMDTLIGEDGRAVLERHYTTHGKDKYHTNPHDHDITWNENGNPVFSGARNYGPNEPIPTLK